MCCWYSLFIYNILLLERVLLIIKLFLQLCSKMKIKMEPNSNIMNDTAVDAFWIEYDTTFFSQKIKLYG